MKNNIENKEKTNKTGMAISYKSFISVVVILLVVIAISGILTLVIPQGSFARDASGQIIAGTYTKGSVKGIEFWRIITAPFRVFVADGNITIIMISLFLLIMSGVFNILDKTSGMRIIMNRTIAKFSNKHKVIICVCVLFFMLFGSLFGLFEELVTLLPFMIILMISLGFDTMSGLGVCLLAACFGFSAAITNPFSVGIASSFAGVGLLNGVWLRIVFFIIIYALTCAFLLHYTNKISKNPERSLSYEIDKTKRENLQVSTEVETDKDKKIFVTYITFFIVEFCILVLTALIRPISGFAVPILAVSFLIGGLLCGMLVDDKKNVLIYFAKGVLSMLPAVLLIALASSVNLIMQESGILDTIMHAVITLLEGKGVFLSLIFIYGLILILQVFIGSASAKIFLVMPILVPICSVIGISPALLILTYCMADGFSDVLLPTNPVLLISLSMANVSYGKWVKWTWKIQLLVLFISLAVLFVGVQVGI